MELIVASTPYSQWQQLRRLLHSLGWTQPETLGPDQWAGNATLASQQACLLLYSPAHIAVAYALEQGLSPSVALQQWHTALEQCLRFYRRHRRQTLLINVTHAVLAPQELQQHCRQHFGINAKPVTLEPMAPPAELNLLLAQRLIMQHAELADLLQELEAGTTPLLNHDAPPNINIDLLHRLLIKQAQECAQHSDLLGQLEEKQQENNQLLAQLHRAQEDLEALRQKNTSNENARHQYQTQLHDLDEKHQRLQARLDSLNLDHDNTQAELQLLQQHNKGVEEENDMLLQQLHQVQEELERYYLNNQQLIRQLDEQQQQIQRNHRVLRKITSSISWKITTPLRAWGKLFRPTSPEQRKLKKQLRMLASSELFNADWYLSTYPDVAESGMDPGEHYLKFGADEGRNPGPHFDTQGYLRLNPNAAETELNPLVHYLKFGQEEGRQPKATA
ncbi:hypothetical protein [Zobellella maritima]|uniref:hypothetical protein n=1 Tax=Zobellella maritima TaxID=2059725 RepID=UPI000E3039E8|nr:hypothetical protein [Zobellella maritima]